MPSAQHEACYSHRLRAARSEHPGTPSTAWQAACTSSVGGSRGCRQAHVFNTVGGQASPHRVRANIMCHHHEGQPHAVLVQSYPMPCHAMSTVPTHPMHANASHAYHAMPSCSHASHAMPALPPCLLASPPRLHVHMGDDGCSGGQRMRTRHCPVDGCCGGSLDARRRIQAGTRPRRGDGQGGEAAGPIGQCGAPVLAHQLRGRKQGETLGSCCWYTTCKLTASPERQLRPTTLRRA